LPSSDPIRRLRDIVRNIDLIRDDVADRSFEAFAADRILQDAVMYRLLRVSEAATKLGERIEDLVPGQPWRQIRAMGNVLRHEYDVVALDQIWLVVTRDLEPLVTACRSAIASLDEGIAKGSRQ
jgi:uncharacterized protein with HEPN domain